MVGRTTWRAIGTWIEVLTVEEGAAQAAAAIVADELAVLDAGVSRFRADAELYRLPSGEPCPASPVVRNALNAALRTAAFTDGLVVPTMGEALRHNGYDADLELVRTRTSVVRLAPPPVPWQRIVVDDAAGTVTLPEGAELDLGASAKAWAADVAAARVHAELGCGVLVNLGGDLGLAGPAPAGGWRITIDDGGQPDEGKRPVIAVGSGGVATSSTRLRSWRTDAGTAHHILDPRTRRPAPRVWQAVTVAAVSAEVANAAATASVILGDAAPGWLTRKGLPARLRHSSGLVVHTPGWPTSGSGGPIAA